MRQIKFLVAFLLCMLSTSPSTVDATDKLRISNCFIGGAILPLWLAKDAGLFQSEGLDVELIWIQGNPSVAALISGQIDLLHCIPHNVLGGIAGGADLVFISSVYNRMQYRIVAAPGIERAEQLKGKLIGVARIHDVSHFYIRLALEKLGINPERDIRVVAVGGQNDRVLALKSGRVAATILNPANALSLEPAGFKTIIDLESLNFPVVGNMQAVRRNDLKARRGVYVRFLRAFMASMHRVQSDPQLSKRTLAKYLRLQDKAIVDENYRFNSGKNLEQEPRIPIDGLRYAIDALVPTLPSAKNLKAEAIIDQSLLSDSLRSRR